MPPISFKEENWTFFSSTQNLAAVLNDPNERKRSSDFFTKTWGAEFEPCDVPPLTLLQAVPKHYFKDYVRKIEFVSTTAGPLEIYVFTCLSMIYCGLQYTRFSLGYIEARGALVAQSSKRRPPTTEVMCSSLVLNI